MKLFIDQIEIEEKPIKRATFMEYSTEVMKIVLSDQRSIQSCKMDGKEITTIDEAETLYPSAQRIDILTIPLDKALDESLEAILLQVSALEQDCESLVTDCLLDEPKSVADSWVALCERAKSIIQRMPNFASRMTESQMNALTDDIFEKVNDHFRDCHAVLSKADVVSFSDVLELKLLPWIRQFKEFITTLRT